MCTSFQALSQGNRNEEIRQKKKKKNWCIKAESDTEIVKVHLQQVHVSFTPYGKNIYVRYISKCIKYIFFQNFYI